MTRAASSLGILEHAVLVVAVLDLEHHAALFLDDVVDGLEGDDVGRIAVHAYQDGVGGQRDVALLPQGALLAGSRLDAGVLQVGQLPQRGSAGAAERVGVAVRGAAVVAGRAHEPSLRGGRAAARLASSTAFTPVHGTRTEPGDTIASTLLESRFGMTEGSSDAVIVGGARPPLPLPPASTRAASCFPPSACSILRSASTPSATW